MKVARVVIDSSVIELIDFYEYLIGDEIINSLTVGMRVEVPFGKYNAHQVGYVIKIYEGEPQVKLKKIIKVLDEVPLINRERLVEAFWVKNMFFSTFSEAIRLFLPFGANITFEEQIVLKASLDDVYAWAKGNSEKGKMADVLSSLGGKTTYSYIKEAVGVHARTMVNELYEKELIDIFHTDRTLAKEKKCKIVRLVDLDY